MTDPHVKTASSTAVTATVAAGIYQSGRIRGRQVSIADAIPPTPVPSSLAGILRYWRFAAVVVAVCVAATAGYVVAVPPKWEASAHILVAPVPVDADLPGLGLINDSVEPARSLQTAIALLDTPAAVAATATELGAPWTSESVDRSIVLQPLGQSFIVEVKARADSPSAAARLATTFVRNALATRNSEIKQRATAMLAVRTRLPAAAATNPNSATTARLELIARSGDPSLPMAEPASRPTAPVGLPAPYRIALSAVLGFCLAVAGAWARMRRTGPDDGWDK